MTDPDKIDEELAPSFVAPAADREVDASFSAADVADKVAGTDTRPW